MGRGLLGGLWLLALAQLASVQAHEVFITNEKDNTVSVIDTKSLQVARTFSVGKRPRGIALSRDGSKLFVCSSDDHVVQVFDPNTGHQIGLFADLPDPEQVALSTDETYLLTTNEDDNLVSIVAL